MARNTAIRVLVAVEVRGAFSNISLDRAISKRGLEPRDAALATEHGIRAFTRAGQLEQVEMLRKMRD